jgi:uroporphyrinogen decarboxylase
MKETMTSRERVIRTLNREATDRFPIDLGSHMSTGISMFAYWHLREYLGWSTEDIWVPDLVQCLAYVEEDVRQRFHVDCILLAPRWPAERRWSPRKPYTFAVPEAFQPRQQQDGSWVASHAESSMRMPAGGFFFDGEWLNSCWHGLSEDKVLQRYAREAERIYKETEYACNFVGYAYGGGLGSFFRGVEQGIRMLTDPDSVREQNERDLERQIQQFNRINEAFGPYIQLITVGDDMGGQNGPLVNPESIERFCVPYYKRLCTHIHRYSDIRVFMHNCGGIEPLLPGLIDAGIDVMNPVQISAAGMDPAHLKSKYGEDIVFWGGGCDTQNVLGVAQPQQVREHVEMLARIFKKGGGFVFNQVHNILGNVPPENIVAMLDTAYKESFYNTIPSAI